MQAASPIILFVMIIAFMYFLVIRPQKRRTAQMQDLQSGLKPGDEVVTMAGIYGIVTELEDGGTLLLEVSEDTEIRVATASVTGLVKDEAAMPTDASVISS